MRQGARNGPDGPSLMRPEGRSGRPADGRLRLRSGPVLPQACFFSSLLALLAAAGPDAPQPLGVRADEVTGCRPAVAHHGLARLEARERWRLRARYTVAGMRSVRQAIQAGPRRLVMRSRTTRRQRSPTTRRAMRSGREERSRRPETPSARQPLARRLAADTGGRSASNEEWTGDPLGGSVLPESIGPGAAGRPGAARQSGAARRVSARTGRRPSAGRRRPVQSRRRRPPLS